MIHLLRFARCAFILTLALFLIPAVQAQWTEEIIPEPGTGYLDSSPSGDTLFISSYSSGLWRSIDRGGEWLSKTSQVTDGVPYFYPVYLVGDTVIVTAMVDHNYSVGFHVYLSFDAGESWVGGFDAWNTPTIPTNYPVTFQVDPLIPSNWYFASDEWVGTSLDAGRTWTYDESGTFPSSHFLFACDPTNPQRIYAGARKIVSPTPYQAIYLSEDGGASWAEIEPNEQPRLAYGVNLWVLPDGDLIVKGQSQDSGIQVLRSPDGGLTWVEDDFGGLDLETYRIQLSYMLENHTIIAFGIEPAPVLRSIDGGESWQEAGLNFPATSGSLGYLSCNPATGIIHGRSRIHGAFRIAPPWETVQWLADPVNGGSFSREEMIAFDEGGIYLCSLAGRLYRSEGDSRYFELAHPVTEGESYYSVYAVIWNDPGLTVVGSYISGEVDGEYVRQEQVAVRMAGVGDWEHHDAPGITKTAVRAADGEGIELISFDRALGTTWVSADTGRTWTEESRLPADVNQWNAHENLIIASIYSNFEHSFMLSTDSGVSWTDLGIAELDPVGSFQASVRTPTGIVVSMLDHSYLIDFQGQVTQLASHVDIGYFSTLAVVPRGEDNFDLYGSNHQIKDLYKAESPWNEWVPADVGQPMALDGVRLNGLAYDPYRNRLYCSNGGWLVSRSLEQAGAMETSAANPLNFDILTSWPNPFNSTTTVQVTLAKPGMARVMLFDLLGREVVRLHEGRLAAGSHAIVLDGADLPSGAYFLRLESPTGLQSRRVTLLK